MQSQRSVFPKMSIDTIVGIAQSRCEQVQEAEQEMWAFHTQALAHLVPGAKHLDIVRIPGTKFGREADDGIMEATITLSDGRRLWVPDVENFFTSVEANTDIPEDICARTMETEDDVEALVYIGAPFGLSVETMRAIGVLCGNLAWSDDHGVEVSRPLGSRKMTRSRRSVAAAVRP